MLLLAAVAMGTLWAIVVLVNAVVVAVRQRREGKRMWVEAALTRMSRRPHLDTSHLLRVPDKFFGMNKRWMRSRTFARRGTRVLVFDQNGDPWMGFITRQNSESLRDGGYVERNYSVPLRGWGEREAGTEAKVKIEIEVGSEVRVKTTYIQSYPRWFDPKKTDTLEWQYWAYLLAEFNGEATGCYSMTTFNMILPESLRAARIKERDEFDRLYTWYCLRFARGAGPSHAKVMKKAA